MVKKWPYKAIFLYVKKHKDFNKKPFTSGIHNHYNGVKWYGVGTSGKNTTPTKKGKGELKNVYWGISAHN